MRSPITIMLHGLDHPDAVEFVAREVATMKQRSEGTGGFSPFAEMAPDVWRRRQEVQVDRCCRSPATEFWRFGKINPTKSIFAYKPFSFGRPLKWTAIWIFCDLQSAESFAESALWERLRRRDGTAVTGCSGSPRRLPGGLVAPSCPHLVR